MFFPMCRYGYKCCHRLQCCCPRTQNPQQCCRYCQRLKQKSKNSCLENSAQTNPSNQRLSELEDKMVQCECQQGHEFERSRISTNNHQSHNIIEPKSFHHFPLRPVEQVHHLESHTYSDKLDGNKNGRHKLEKIDRLEAESSKDNSGFIKKTDLAKSLEQLRESQVSNRKHIPIPDEAKSEKFLKVVDLTEKNPHTTDKFIKSSNKISTEQSKNFTTVSTKNSNLQKTQYTSFKQKKVNSFKRPLRGTTIHNEDDAGNSEKQEEIEDSSEKKNSLKAPTKPHRNITDNTTKMKKNLNQYKPPLNIHKQKDNLYKENSKKSIDSSDEVAEKTEHLEKVEDLTEREEASSKNGEKVLKKSEGGAKNVANKAKVKKSLKSPSRLSQPHNFLYVPPLAKQTQDISWHYKNMCCLRHLNNQNTNCINPTLHYPLGHHCCPAKCSCNCFKQNRYQS